MSRLHNTARYTFPIGIVCILIGMFSGAIGVCGGGGWGVIPAIIGFIALLTGIICLFAEFFRNLYRKLRS